MSNILECPKCGEDINTCKCELPRFYDPVYIEISSSTNGPVHGYFKTYNKGPGTDALEEWVLYDVPSYCLPPVEHYIYYTKQFKALKDVTGWESFKDLMNHGILPKIKENK